MATIPASEVVKGQVVRFRPLGNQTMMVFNVTDVGVLDDRWAKLYGYRSKLGDDGYGNKIWVGYGNRMMYLVKLDGECEVMHTWPKTAVAKDSWHVYTQHWKNGKVVTRVADFPDFDSALAYGRSISPDIDGSMMPNVDEKLAHHRGYEKGLFWFGNNYGVITNEVGSKTSTLTDYWDRSGSEPVWRQPHDELVKDALTSWKGDNSTLAIHMRDAREGVPVRDNGGAKIMRSQAEAILYELSHNAKPVPRLYRGDNNQPQGIRGWSTNRRTATIFSRINAGPVWVLVKGSCSGISIADYKTGSGRDQDEQEWIVDTPAGLAVPLSAVTATNDHVAKPQPAPPGGPKFEVYAKPFVCAVCGKPIEHPHRGGGAWRHVKTAAVEHKMEGLMSVGTSGAYVVGCSCGWATRVEGVFEVRKKAIKAWRDHRDEMTKTAALDLTQYRAEVEQRLKDGNPNGVPDCAESSAAWYVVLHEHGIAATMMMGSTDAGQDHVWLNIDGKTFDVQPQLNPGVKYDEGYEIDPDADGWPSLAPYRKTAASQQDIGFNNSKFFYWGTTDIGLAQAKQSGEIRDGNDRFVIISTRFEDVSDSPVAATMALPMVWLWDNIDPDVREMAPNQKEFFRIMALWSGELNVLAPIPARYLKTMGKGSGLLVLR